MRRQLGELREALGDPIAPLLPIILYMVLIWGAMEWLRRKGWIIKIGPSQTYILMRYI